MSYSDRDRMGVYRKTFPLTFPIATPEPASRMIIAFWQI